MASRICSFEYGTSMKYMEADWKSRSMWSRWRKTAVPRGVSYARTPSNTPVP